MPIDLIELGQTAPNALPRRADPLGIEDAANDLDPLGIGAGQKSDPLGIEKRTTLRGMANALLREGTRGLGRALQGAAAYGEAWPAGYAAETLPAPPTEESLARPLRSSGELMRDIERNPAYVYGQALEQVAPEVHPVPPGEENSLGTKAAGMAGSFVPLIASGAAGPAVIGLQAAGEHISADFEQGKAEGLDDDAAAQRALDRAVLSGTLQAGIFFALPKPIRAVAEKYLVAKLGQAGFTRWLTGRASAAGEGAILGATSAGAENVVQGKPVTEGTGAAAAGLAGANLLLPWLRPGGRTKGPSDQGTKGPGPEGEPPKEAPPPASKEDLAGLQARLQKNQITQNKVLQAVEELKQTKGPKDEGTKGPGPEEEGLTAGAEGETTAPYRVVEGQGGAGAETSTGQNERTGSEGPGGLQSASGPGPMPAEAAAAPIPRPPSTLERDRDILDEVLEIGKISLPKARAIQEDFKPTGVLRAAFTNQGGMGPDEALDALHRAGLYHRLETEDDLLDALRAAGPNRARQATEARVQAKQHEQFESKVLRGERPWREQGVIGRVRVDDLLEGDEFSVQGFKFRVQELEIDDDGRLLSLQVKDGPKFGVQRIGADQAEFIHVDKESLRPAPGHPAIAPGSPQQAEANASVGAKLATETKTPGGEAGGSPAQLPGDTSVTRSASGSEPGQTDPVKAWLERAIAATDAGRGRTLEGVSGAPVWVTKALANGALRVMLQAYKSGKKLLGAINEAVRWLEDQRIKGFNQAEAQEWLLKEAKKAGVLSYGGRPAEEYGIGPETVQSPESTVHSQEAGARSQEPEGKGPAPAAPGAERGEPQSEAPPVKGIPVPVMGAESLPAETGEGKPYQNLIDRLQAIGERLNQIQVEGRRSMTDKLRSERHELAKESREVRRSLAQHPEYVADVLRKVEQVGNDLVNARQAGHGAKARDLAEEFQSLTEELQYVPERLRMQVYNDLVARGEILKSQTGELPTGRTLGQMTDWLRAQKLDSPKLNLRERFSLARALADRWGKAKDTFSQAADRVSAAWEAFKAQYQAPPRDDNFRSLVKDWLFAKQWTGLETFRWVQEIRRKVSSPLRRQAISVWLDAGGDRALLASQAALVPERYRRVWQAALKLTPDEELLARRVKTDFDQKLEDGQNAGLIEKGRQDYGVPQLWAVKPKFEGEYDPATRTFRTPRHAAAKLDPRDPFFSLQRTHESYFDGIMAGGAPRSLDIADLVGFYNSQFHDALADRGVIKALRDAKDKEGNPLVIIAGGAVVKPGSVPGSRAYFLDSRRAPKEAVTKDGRLYQTVDHWALRDWVFRSRDEAGNPILLRGDFLVHPDYVKFLRNELGQSAFQRKDASGKYEHPVLHGALAAMSYLKASKFASATFHMATIGEHAMFHLVSPLTRGVEMRPENNPKLAALMRHGLDLGFHRHRELFEEGLSSHGGIWGLVPYLGDAMHGMSQYLFQDYIPKIKVKTGLAILERNLQRYQGKLSGDQILELTARQANAAFGIQNWRLMGTNKTLLDVNRLFFTAPDFLLSRSKVVAQALKPFNREQRYFLLGQAAVVYTVSRVANFFTDDDPHWEPENALSVIYHGRAYSARFIVNDMWHLITDPVSFAQGRFGPLPRSAIEAATQRDMRSGTRIDVPIPTNVKAWRAAQILVKDLAMWFVPVGFEGTLPGAAGRQQTGPGQVGLALVGVGSHKYTAQTQIWQLAAGYNRSSADPAAQHYQQRRDAEAREASAYVKLDNLLDAGELERARKEYAALVAEGYKPSSIAAHYARAQYYTGSAAREAAFRKSLTAGQKEIYQRAQAERRERFEKFRALRQSTVQPAATARQRGEESTRPP